jgi:hypothetical protein
MFGRNTFTLKGEWRYVPVRPSGRHKGLVGLRAHPSKTLSYLT